MTLLEMLSMLESEVLALRTENERLKNGVQPKKSVAGAPKHRASKSKSAAKGKKAGARSKSVAAHDTDLPATPQQTPGQDQQQKLGKRQALGRSILRLRAVATTSSAE